MTTHESFEMLKSEEEINTYGVDKKIKYLRDSQSFRLE
jgi:hypothetical protein